MIVIASWMRRQAGLLCGLLFATPAFAGHPGSADLNPRQATPGLRLEVQEITSGREHLPKKYRLIATDYPRHVLFSVYTKEFSDSFVEIVPGFRVDASGNMVSNNSGTPRRLEDLEFSPGPYPRGAAWEVAIASADRSIAVFARVIPYPLMTQSGACSLSLELLTQRGDRFLVTGSGFSPGDDVMTEAKFDGRVETKGRRILDDGRLPRHVIAHAAIGTDRNARYSVKGRKCTVVIEYVWGKPAVSRR